MEMSLVDAVILFLAAVGGGALNSVAGGGSFISFPTLLFTGVPPIVANATNTVALWPGTLASAGAYRRELKASRSRIVPLSVISVVGGYAGAQLLLHTPEATFEDMIPWLLLAATLVFAFGSPLLARLRARRRHAAGAAGAEAAGADEAGGALSSRTFSVVGIVLQLVIAVYGGFFGGGIGILMLAALTLAGMENVHAMNGLKNWLAGCINGIAVVAFVAADAVWWPQAVVMIVGAVLGGYGGASLARRVDPRRVRRFVILVGAAMTIYFFVWG